MAGVREQWWTATHAAAMLHSVLGFLVVMHLAQSESTQAAWSSDLNNYSFWSYFEPVVVSVAEVRVQLP